MTPPLMLSTHPNTSDAGVLPHSLPLLGSYRVVQLLTMWMLLSHALLATFLFLLSHREDRKEEEGQKWAAFAWEDLGIR